MTIAKTLSGGDRRSIGEVDSVVESVLGDARLLAQLVSALDAADPVVAMRAADALEKVSRQRAEWLARYRSRLMRSAVRTTDLAVRWNLAELLPRLPFDRRSTLLLAHRLEVWYLTDPSTLVRVHALEALVTLARRDARLRPAARRILAEAVRAGSPAVRARARRLRAQQWTLRADEEVPEA
jgi:hypothetical protein